MASQEEPQDEQLDPEEEAVPLDSVVHASHEDELFVVAIGTSAGGEEALTEFFQNTPSNTGIAFLVLQHSKSQFLSLLVDALKRLTAMDVMLGADEMALEQNKVYILPTDVYTTLLENTIHFVNKPASHDPLLAIDMLLIALAEAKGETGIGIILSGRGSDGTSGIKALKAAGGLVMVQSPDSAEFSDMPGSAIETDIVDYVLPPEEMPAELLRYIRFTTQQPERILDLSQTAETTVIQRIFILLRTYTGHDFSLYKRKTVNRRLQRRIIVNQLEDLNAYYDYLQRNPDEITRLFYEMLIGVTQFFRDAESFHVLEEKVIPMIFGGKRPDERIRVWIPGCSTGEEAYSLAILFQEHLETLDASYRVQIFATDIDENAIQTARAGLYPLTISAHVSPRRLQRFFTREGDAYRIRKQLREMVTFAVQSVVKDPPFSKLDLISCRNLLIYLRPELQRKLIPLFHYVLNPGGFLFLGTSETLNSFTHYFEPVNRKWKIFRRIENLEALHTRLDLPFSAPVKRKNLPTKVNNSEPTSMRDLIEQMLIERYSPPAVLVNHEGDILYFHKRTEKYLEPVTGEVSINVIRMAREGLKLPVSTAIRRVQSQQQDIVYKGIQVKKNGDYQTINLNVHLLREPEALRGLILITFEDVDVEPILDLVEVEIDPLNESNQRIKDLESELGSTKEYLQAVVEELEASNEELKSVNEELNASNEELQSTNEELETASEELQSVNEELTTANSELENKLRELTDLNNDLSDLLLNVDVGIIFLDRQLRIRRFTPDATRFVNLISSDIGRPLADLVTKFDYDRLLQDARRVLDTLAPVRVEIRAEDDQWYLVKIAPYETIGGAIIGVVVSFTDMSEQRQFEEQMRELQTNEAHFPELPFPKVERLFSVVEAWQTRTQKGQTENDLVEQFCHLLVSHGGYAMAWVRFTNGDSEPRQIGIQPDGDQPETGGDGHTAEEETPMVVPRSSGQFLTIALPLRVDHAMNGTLHIYTEQTTPVSEQELSLLQRLANMLAQSIQWKRQQG